MGVIDVVIDDEERAHIGLDLVFDMNTEIGGVKDAFQLGELQRRFVARPRLECWCLPPISGSITPGRRHTRGA